MTVTCHPSIGWDCCTSEDEKKEIEPFFTHENYYKFSAK